MRSAHDDRGPNLLLIFIVIDMLDDRRIAFYFRRFGDAVPLKFFESLQPPDLRVKTRILRMELAQLVQFLGGFGVLPRRLQASRLLRDRIDLFLTAADDRA